MESLLWTFLYMSPHTNVQVFLLLIHLAVEFLGHRICEPPTVLKNACLFSKVVVLIYILICSGWEFLAPHHCQQIMAWPLNCCQLGECDIMSHLGFKLQFLDHQWVWSSLNIYLPFTFFFCEMLFMSFFCLVIFFLMIHRNSLYALLMSSFPDIGSTNFALPIVQYYPVCGLNFILFMTF